MTKSQRDRKEARKKKREITKAGKKDKWEKDKKK